MNPLPAVPAELGVPPTILRRWRTDDAGALHQVIHESRDHLVPWMPWASDDPVDLEWRRGWLTSVVQTFDADEAYDYAIFDGDVLIGGCSLHALDEGPRIGYWLHPAHTGQGHATRATRALIGLARSLECSRVLLRCDEANHASAAVAGRLGFSLLCREQVRIDAPGQTGTSLLFVLDLG